jgi:hypothetical protein
MARSKPKAIVVPEGALSAKDFVESKLRPAVAEEGAAAVAARAEISVSLLHMVLRGERLPNHQLAGSLGCDVRELRFYIPRK